MKLTRKIKALIIAGIGIPVALAAPVVVIDAQRDPYIETEGDFKIAKDSTIKDAGKTEVVLSKDKPEIRLKRWNGEVDLGIAYTKVKGKGKRQLLTELVEWKGDKEEVHAYPLEAKAGMEDGGFEIEIVLSEKPTTNKFDFTLEGTEDLDFFYQPALTPEEIAEGVQRPENVVGSYAVYHKTKKNHTIGQTNYATGKVYHIYRPKAIDADGEEQWAVLSYNNGILTVEVPQTFLDTASYPVRVDPTFGYTTIGASAVGFCQDQTGGEGVSDSDIENRQGYGIALTEAGTLTSLHVALDTSAGSETVDSVVFLNVEDTVTDSHTQAVSVEAENLSLDTTEAFKTFNAGGGPISADDYVLNFVCDGNDIAGNLESVRGWRDTADTRNRYQETFTNYAAAHESPWTETDAASTASNWSIYATYTASAASTPPDPGTTVIFE